MDKKFLDEARSLALLSKNVDDVPVGAVVVLDGKIIGQGFNKKESQKNAVLHAEIEAISDACKNIGNWRLDGADIYVTLEPCLMCLGAIFNARIKNVYFGTRDTSRGDAKVFDVVKTGYMNHSLGEYACLEDAESKKILTDFFKKRRLENRK